MFIKEIVFVFVLFSSVLSFADVPVKLDIRLDIDGVLISHPTATLKFGEKGSITQYSKDGASSYIIEVTPIRKSRNEVQMSFAIKKSSQGQTVLLSSPRIVSLFGQVARVEQKSDNSSVMKLTVIPRI